jgi:outer membrane autotransporter protein
MRIESVSLAISRALAAAVLLTAAVGSVSPASAQNAFCNRPGFSLQGGFCTDGAGEGAFSAAALSSQSLNQVTQSVTQQSDQKTAEAIDRRRTEEQQRQQVAPQRQQERAAAPAPAKKGKKVARAPARAPSGPVFKSDPGERMAPVPYIQPVRPAVWAQAFGDYERRSASIITPSGGVNAIGAPALGLVGGPDLAPTLLNLATKAETWGFIGGADLTFRNLANPSDGLIIGFLTGYMEQDITFRNQTNLRARVEGPSVGVFASYFNGGFSGDITFKADFLDLTQSWAEVQVFNTGNTFVNVGTGKTDFVNYTVQGNLNYRIPINPVAFIEPTVGFRYIRSDYAAGAGALFGLDDGEVWRVQGGAKLGANYDMGNVIVTPSITGLAYSDVSITGGVLNSVTGPFTSTAGGVIIATDEGKIRGMGIGALNFDWKNGVQAFVEGNVRGGEDLWGYGGRGGIRVQF